MTDLINAFFVEIGLDRAKFDAQRQEAINMIADLKKRILGDATEIEEATQKAVSQSFRTVERHFLGFFAALAGAQTVRNFVTSVTQAETRLGILANVLGTSVPSLNAFQLAVQRTGGTIEGATSSLQALNNIVMQANLEGQAGPSEFYRLGGSSVDPRADRVTQMIQLADAMARTNYSEAQKIQMLGRMGIEAATAQLMLDPGVLRGLLGQTVKDAVTPEQAAGGTQLTGAWFGASQAIQSFGRAVLLNAQGPMTNLLNQLRDWVEANKDAAAGWFGEKARELKDWVDGLDWAKIKETTKEIVGAVKTVVTAVGGWKHAAEGVGATWLLLQAAPILSVGAAVVAMASPLGDVLVGLTAVLAAFKVYENMSGPKPYDATAGGPNDVGGRSDGKSGTADSITIPTFDVPPPSSVHAARRQHHPRHRRHGRSSNVPSRSATPEEAETDSNGNFVAPGSGQQIETSEGAVSEGRPLPVKIMNLDQQDDTFWGYIGKAFGKLGNWFTSHYPGGGTGGGLHRPSSREGGYTGPINRPSGGARGAGSAGFGLYATDIGLASNKDLSPEARAFLDTLGTGETPHGSYSNSDSDPGGLGGRYQFLKSTWVSEARKAGVDPANFSPENQDKVAFFYANEVVRERTGQDLTALLKSGPDGVRRAIAALSPGVWNAITNVEPKATRSTHASAVQLYLKKLQDEQKNAFPATPPPYVNPAAQGAANAAKTSMLVHDHHYNVARVDVTAHGATGSHVAREVRESLERELANFQVA
jgi:hypothetical protein